MATYDYVIVGGGSAGSVLAHRLSADPSTTVLVLEAGRSDFKFDPLIHMPAALMFPSGNPLYDWAYASEPEPHMNGRRIAHARGKVLGGSSSINGMIFQRGNPTDYDRWARENEGMEHWDYAHCLPYFKRMETAADGANAWRGASGPLKMSKGPASSPLFQAFFEAARQAGYPMTDDVNGYRQEGFAPFDRNLIDGHRQSASRSYLWPIRNRKNLTIHTLSMVTGLKFDGNRVTGVEYKRGRKNETVTAGDVILCGGAFNSPQLLQLAGIGDPETLTAAGVTPRINLPGVGANMQDHLEVYLQHKCAEPVSIGPWLNYWKAPFIGASWLLGKGVGTSNHFEGGGFIRTNNDVEYPNLMFHFLPIAVRYDGSGEKGSHGYQVHIGPMNSDVMGTLKIRSTNPFEHPELRFNYLSTEKDRREWVEVVRAARYILDQPAMRPFDAGETSPGPDVQSDEAILEWVKNDAETALHPSCTAAMGKGDMSVVNPDTMQVHGVEGLRVVDASVMPTITNGNIYAPTMMIAEKAADLIAGNTPLPPEHAPVYLAKHDMPIYPDGDARNNGWDARRDLPSAAELAAKQQGENQ
ncbi:choline dehydrogenase [Dermatophilus congolensis]|nr:choline dehydrogenase [Dermatophilus congolensis]MBO3151377.1 choline dehydrogenase [Dermatophilus congolensis]MBO3161619.1 choline dehydrogenase [Dermatophilus congolensis]MBO3162663.1 choline dehydrogenase [Dermatophilus congolensis]MBO3176216.1 choline dehydrogenase [Dermatophilus congolensis]